MSITGKTRVLGIFGDPVSHSLSPVMQNEALGAVPIDAIYVPFHVKADRLPEAVDAIRSLNLLGVNVTVPHKEAICSLLDALDDTARLVGAVNTVVNEKGRLVGHNTDGTGLLTALRTDLDFNPRDRRILLLGAGGACRAALAVLARSGAAWIGIANRNFERARKLAREFSPHFKGTAIAELPLQDGDGPDDMPGGIDLVINTTSLGLKEENAPPVPWQKLSPGACVYDMVYRIGAETPLLAMCNRRGIAAADGKGMLAAQGEEAFYLWTGIRPPPGVMKARLLAELS